MYKYGRLNNFVIYKNFVATFPMETIRYQKYIHGNVKIVCKKLS